VEERPEKILKELTFVKIGAVKATNSTRTFYVLYQSWVESGVTDLNKILLGICEFQKILPALSMFIIRAGWNLV
jgi:hypothetical protein